MLSIDLSGKKALVTGSARGIGAAIAYRFAECGADVAVNAVNNLAAAEDLAEAIRSLGVRSVAVKADVSDFSEARSLVEAAISALGGLDILVNNAGITRDNLLLRMDESDWDPVINTNLKGVFNCTQAAIKGFVKQRQGVVINIASVVGVYGNAGQANYAAAKAGIIGFSKAVAKELGSRNIRVNVIAPGFIDTDMTNELSDSVRQKLLGEISLGRLGLPEEIANVAAFLASDLSSYISGQTVIVDGMMG